MVLPAGGVQYGTSTGFIWTYLIQSKPAQMGYHLIRIRSPYFQRSGDEHRFMVMLADDGYRKDTGPVTVSIQIRQFDDRQDLVGLMKADRAVPAKSIRKHTVPVFAEQG